MPASDERCYAITARQVYPDASRSFTEAEAVVKIVPLLRMKFQTETRERERDHFREENILCNVFSLAINFLAPSDKPHVWKHLRKLRGVCFHDSFSSLFLHFGEN